MAALSTEIPSDQPAPFQSNAYWPMLCPICKTSHERSRWFGNTYGRECELSLLAAGEIDD